MAAIDLSSAGSDYLNWLKNPATNQPVALPPSSSAPIPPVPTDGGTNLSAQINAQNPTGDASKPYVQAGNTGGYIDGIGVTIGPGSSLTPAQAKAHYDAGVAKYGQGAVDSFLSRNPNDYARIDSGLADLLSGPSGGSGGASSNLSNAIASAQGGASAYPGFTGTNPGGQFTDPYTHQLETIAQQFLDTLSKPQQNPALDNLLAFLNQRFADLSTNPGYTPDQLAVLRTQALDPIEQDRQAAQQAALARAAARGLLPSSGVLQNEANQIDLAHNQLRGAAQRDLAINAINRQDQNLSQALTLGQLAGVTIPQQEQAQQQSQQNQALGIANLLYNLPRQAQQDALAVINSAPAPGNLLSQAIQLLQANNDQANVNSKNNAAFWNQIGNIIAGLNLG